MISDVLKNTSLVCANFGNGAAFENILNDWFAFLGGKPAEVVVVDGGSGRETQEAYWKLFKDGMINKLQLIRPEHSDNNRHTCFIQEHTAGAIASMPYLLFFKSDTLPYREGHENWLSQAIGYLERDDTFAVGGSFNDESKHHDAWPGWYFSHKCSENFALMKRSTFIAAMEEFAGEYISSGFRTLNPAAGTGQSRYLIEVAFERYISRHSKYTLVKIEDPTWTVFHTNVQGEQLMRVRDDYLARKGIEEFMNAGCTGVRPPGRHYGKEPIRMSLTKRLRIAFGSSSAGPLWRRMKGSLFGSVTGK